jgi:ATP-dependent DNA ligase
MEAVQVAALPDAPGWQFEPKWDGFRCIARRDGAKVALQSKSGKPLNRYFPEIVAAVAAASLKRFTVDGELCIPAGDSLSFEDLQLRLHPAASRVAKLAAATPAVLILFDILDRGGKDLRGRPLAERRAALEDVMKRLGTDPVFRLSPYTRKAAEAKKWLRKAGAGALDGVVAKRIDGAYESGARAMLKVKCLRTADCVVGGFRYASKGGEVGSLLLGLYNDEGVLDHVGFTSGLKAVDRAALTRKLERLKGGEGFTGAAPGAPSRWSTDRSAAWVPLRPKLVAEVQYDHATGARFRHGTRFLRWRPDKAPRQCTMDQLQQALRPSKLIPVMADKGLRGASRSSDK